jgi:hypothetical protein
MTTHSTHDAAQDFDNLIHEIAISPSLYGSQTPGAPPLLRKAHIIITGQATLMLERRGA